MEKIVSIDAYPAALRKPEIPRALPMPERRINPLAAKRRAEDPCALVRLLNEWQDEAYWERAEQEKRIKQEREARILAQREAAIEAREWAELKADLWAAAAAVIAMGAILWQILM